MNSLSMFEGAENPLLSYLGSVSHDYSVPAGVQLEIGCTINITLPNKKCVITLNHDVVTINRLSNLNAYVKEREAHYQITSIEVAKNMVGMLSGICYEFGCETYKDADTTVKLIYHFLLVNLSKPTAVVI